MTCPRCHCHQCTEERRASSGDALLDGLVALLTRLRGHANGTDPIYPPTRPFTSTPNQTQERHHDTAA